MSSLSSVAWSLRFDFGPLSFVYSGVGRGIRQQDFDILLPTSPNFCWQRKCCVRKGNRMTENCQDEKKNSVMRNLSVCACLYIFSDICEYVCICLSISDFGIDIFFMYKQYVLFRCVYNLLSFSPCTSTLSSCHSRNDGLCFIDGDVQS